MEKILSKNETKEKALRLLGFRSHSEKELREKLKRAGSVAEDIDDVVVFLNEYGFLNDEKYAFSKARDLAKLKKFGRKRIASELKMLGISQEYIDEAIADIDIDENEVLLPLVRKKLNGDFERKSIDRTFRYFASKGYNFEDIKACIENVKTNNMPQLKG